MEIISDPPCEECGRDLPDFADGTANAQTVERFVARMQRRDRCQRCYETYKKTIELCRHHINRATPPNLAERLSEFLRASGCCKKEEI